MLVNGQTNKYLFVQSFFIKCLILICIYLKYFHLAFLGNISFCNIVFLHLLLAKPVLCNGSQLIVSLFYVLMRKQDKNTNLRMIFFFVE